MKLRKPFLFLFSITALSTLGGYAQTPELKITGKANAAEQQSVYLKSLHVDVQITGNIATTVMTMVFMNSNTKVLEGELTFPMPEGVSISRYAIDINGKMREAVPVEKEKATEVFESIERRRVDPGLLEKVEGNNFRTRIYPLPAGGIRTIMIGYEEELHFGDKRMLTYRLPLDYKKPIPEFSLKTTVLESHENPVMEEQPDGSFNFKAKGGNYIAMMQQKDFMPKHGLTINLPKVKTAIETLMQPAGNSFYFLTNVFMKESSRPHQWSKHIGLIWDVSLGGLNRNTHKELELLDAFIVAQKNLTIELGLLNNTLKKGGTFIVTDGNWKTLRDKLEHVVYDGGSDYSKINSELIGGEEYLFFSDGFSGFGPQNVNLNQPVYTINSSLKADYSNLKNISAHCGGKFLNLNTLSVKEAFRQMLTEDLQFLGIKSNPSVSEIYPSAPVSINGSLSIAGISNTGSTQIVLQFGYGSKVIEERKVELKSIQQEAGIIEVNKIWAQKKITEMDVHYEDNKAEISDLGKQFGLVTRNTSLLVLENVADYIRYDIIPPAELRAEYDKTKKQARMAMAEQKEDLLEAAKAMAIELKDWWNTDFMQKKVYPKANNQVRFPAPVVANDRVADAERQERRVESDILKAESSAKLSEVVVTGYAVRGALAGRIAGVQVSETVKRPEIVVPEFKSDKAYMKKLNGSVADGYQQYLLMRKEYISTPSFYFDVANWFYGKNDQITGLMILSNLTELDLENSDIYKTLTYKLRQNGNYNQELLTSKKIVQWRGMEAQSYRDYALALADCGYYQQALDMLYSVLTKSYNTEISGRDEGIEEIIIAEINNLISLHGEKLNTSKIDKELIHALPVDVRVVLNWNKNDTDIDLWVTDPNGEKCFYSNPSTRAGGRISDDFTSGYGPEQFMIKKAIKGKYTIQVDYYGDNQLSISGPTTVMAEIYTHYGTPAQQRKVIALQLSGKKAEGVLIGSFSF